MKYCVCHVSCCLSSLKQQYASLIHFRLCSTDRGTLVCVLPSASSSVYVSPSLATIFAK